MRRFIRVLALAVLAATLIGVYCAAASKSKNQPFNIAVVAADGSHSLALSSEGKLYAAGDNSEGQLGLGDAKDRDVFTLVSSLEDKKIVAIEANGECSFALDSDGKLYVAGRNRDGQLGLGDAKERDVFTLVSSLEGKKIVAIAAGSFHSLALDSNGKVYAAGENNVGQLGLGDKSRRWKFTEVSALSDKKIVAIAAGGSHSLALDNEGKVYASGFNEYGQLGLGDSGRATSRKAFTLVSSLSGKNITRIAAYYGHSLALSSKGKLYAAGFNDHGQLGLGDKDNRNNFTLAKALEGKEIVAIETGNFHSLALDSNGKFYATGSNGDSELGLDDNKDRDVWTLVSSLEDKKIVGVAAGDFHSLALDSDGRIYAAGRNKDGQLGLGDAKRRDVFTPIVLPNR
ncbi:MAG: hypothetical protein LBO72_04205 [Helicobacteraceae bacterium]|jgi:alpha-tubulin suppressor-like RCC1 family protein|nr:hypothetical protein [Helicobacteraceae bacterium]